MASSESGLILSMVQAGVAARDRINAGRPAVDDDVVLHRLMATSLRSVAGHARYRVGWDNLDDALSEVNLKLYRELPTLREGRNSVAAYTVWLHLVAESVSRDFVKRLMRDPVDRTPRELPEQPDDRAARELVAVDLTDLDEHLRRYFKRLPPEFAEVVYLAAFEGMSMADIASELAVPIGTVASRLYRARKKLARVPGMASYMTEIGLGRTDIA
jgi:RNA polymerase sigma-70 factor (ECF subfamily)